MATTNITNTTTGQTGYQVPGAAPPAGWTSSGALATPTQVATGVSKAISGGGSGSNPKDAPGYVPGTLPGDNVPTPAPAGQTPPVNTQQPNPATVNATPIATGAATGLSPDQALASLQKSVAQSSSDDALKQKYSQAHSDLQGSGVQAPANQGSANAGVQTALNSQPTPQAPTPTTTANVDNFFNPETNPALQQSTQDLMNFISPESTRADINNQMSALLSDESSLSADKLQLMNIKNVMSGTADDLRNEITASGGFATDSQIQALAVGRNAALLKQASLLQDSVTAQQDMVANDTTLLNFEKDMANTQATQRMGILNYQNTNEKDMLNAARTSLSEMQKTEGWDGIYKAALATGDPSAISKINATMGTGFDLATAAKNDTTTAMNAADLASKNASTANTIANTKKTNQEIGDASGLPNPAKANAPGYNAGGIKYTPAVAAAELKSEWGDLGTRNLLPPSQYNQAKAWWVEQGLKDTDFDSVFGGQKDTSLKTQYN